MKKIFYIYKIVCTVNGRCYVGKSYDPALRFYTHSRDRGKTPLARCFKKYGEAAMQLEVLACARTEADAFAAERQLITQWNTKKPHGLNLTDGGDGVSGLKHSKKTRQKLSAMQLGKKRGPHSATHRAALTAALQTPEMRAKISAGVRASMTPEVRAKIGAGSAAAWQSGKHVEHAARLRGRKNSPKCRAAIRASWTPERRRALGIAAAERQRGKKLSPAHRAAVKASWVIRRLRQETDALIADQVRML